MDARPDSAKVAAQVRRRKRMPWVWVVLAILLVGCVLAIGMWIIYFGKIKAGG